MKHNHTGENASSEKPICSSITIAAVAERNAIIDNNLSEIAELERENRTRRAIIRIFRTEGTQSQKAKIPGLELGITQALEKIRLLTEEVESLRRFNAEDMADCRMPDESDRSEAPPPEDEAPEDGSDTAQTHAGDTDPSVVALLTPDPEAEGVEAVLLKDVADLTEDEVRRGMASDAYWVSDHPDRIALLNKVTAWHEHVHGTAPRRLDTTGRGIESDPVAPPPAEPIALRTPQGEPVDAALTWVGARLGALSGVLGAPRAAKALQRGLNVAARGSAAPLKLDGVIGPKTRKATRHVLAWEGRDRVSEGLALGGLAEAAQERDGAATLARVIDTAVAPLYAASPETGRAHGAAALQIGLNDTRSERETILTEDGIAGPVTAGALQSRARQQDPDTLALGLGRALGWAVA